MASAATEAPSTANTKEAASIAPAPSKLGTKQHWDEIYEREVSTYAEIGDEGEVWFGEDSAEDMVEWIEENLTDKEIKIMDVGCGNGDLTFRLLIANYTNAIGVDYSEASIALAKAIAVNREVGNDTSTFQVLDILQAEQGERAEAYDLLCDKGTYDAITLSEDKVDGRLLREIYPIRMAALLKPGGILLLTSCNWTKKELEAAFISPETGFTYHSHIPRSSFTFGGATGQSITTIAFEKS